METEIIPFQLKFKIDEKTSSTVVLTVLKELHPKYQRFYNQLVFEPPYPVDFKEWKPDDASSWKRTVIPFLKSQLLNIELSLWEHINILQGTHTQKHTNNAVRFLNLLKIKPCVCPEPKEYIKW